MGVPSLGIFFDDVPPALARAVDQQRYADLGEAQADFLGRLHARLPHIHLMTVPTFYCGEPDIPYLHSLAAMPLKIDIMWTGPAICSREVRSDHMREVADVLRRRPCSGTTTRSTTPAWSTNCTSAPIASAMATCLCAASTPIP